MVCPFCRAQNQDDAEHCFRCGKAMFALTEGSVLNERYDIAEPLGKGGMGMVYRAHDRELDEVVAIKVLRADLARSAEATRRFRSEIKLARRVRHRNVCAIHEYGQDGHLRYIVMEYVDGVDLKRVLREKGPLPPADAFEVAIQLGKGLQAIHDVGIVHRDLKTTNVMRDGEGRIRLMDFGIAKQFDGEGSGATASGHVIGTPEYMSPEQARAERVDARSDIYALGIVVYELFTGAVPFRGDTPVVTMFKHLQEPLPLTEPPADRLPPPLRRVLARSLAKDREERYPTVRDMVDDLRAARDEWLAAGQSSAVVAPPSAGPGERAPETEGISTTLPTPVPTPVPTPAAADLTSRLPTPAPSPPPPPPRSARPAATAGLRGLALVAPLVLVAAAAAAVWGWQRSRVPVAEPEATLAPVIPVEAQAAPVVLEEEETPPAPAPPPPTAAQRARVSPSPPPRQRPSPAPTPRAERVAAAGRAPASPAPAVPQTGLLKLLVRPYAEIAVDGRTVGTSPPLPPLTLPPGSHVVRLSHPDYHPLPKSVTIRAGETTLLEVDLVQEAIPR